MTRISSAVVACVLFFGTLHVAARHVIAWSAMAMRQIQAGERGPLTLNEEIRVALGRFVEKYVILLELVWVVVLVAWGLVRVVQRIKAVHSGSSSSAP